MTLIRSLNPHSNFSDYLETLYVVTIDEGLSYLIL